MMNDFQENNTLTPEVLPPQKPISHVGWYHPLAGLVMMALDFGGSVGDVTGFLWVLFLPLVILGIFAVSTSAIAFIQIRVAGDDPKTAFTKGAIAGILCAIPTPIFGTALGSIILLKSGLKNLSDKEKKS
ncbi:MAG: hypothetical protein ACOY3I_08170 [Verrucomicrobiota bacterium]